MRSFITSFVLVALGFGLESTANAKSPELNSELDQGFYLGVETGLMVNRQPAIYSTLAGEEVLVRGSGSVGPYFRLDLGIAIGEKYIFGWSGLLALPLERTDHWDPREDGYDHVLGMGNILGDELSLSRRVGWSTVGLRLSAQSHQTGDQSSLVSLAAVPMMGPEFTTDLARVERGPWVRLRVNLLAAPESVRVYSHIGADEALDKFGPSLAFQTNVGITVSTAK